MPIQFPIAVMKSVWKRDKAEGWAIHDIRELKLSGDDNSGQRYFLLRGDIEMLTSRPGGFSDVMSLFGTVEYLIQQSIVPVVAWLRGDNQIKCIGTASIISCSGYVITAAHVILDPLEAGYGAVRVNKQVKYRDDLNLGVLIPYWAPLRGIYSRKAYRFFPFVHMRAWGNWIESPLIHESDRWEHLTDVAVCKIPKMPDGQAHQPLNLSLNPFPIGEDAYALGYAEMPDIELIQRQELWRMASFVFRLTSRLGTFFTHSRRTISNARFRRPDPASISTREFLERWAVLPYSADAA